MPPITGKITAPILSLIAQEVLALLRQDAELRATQSQNAPRATYFDQQVAINTLYTITQAFSGTGEFFSNLTVTFDPTNGTGRYRIDGADPTAAGGGHSIPSGGGVLTIQGHDNIRNFKMIAETGQTQSFARQLFK